MTTRRGHRRDIDVAKNHAIQGRGNAPSCRALGLVSHPSWTSLTRTTWARTSTHQTLRRGRPWGGYGAEAAGWIGSTLTMNTSQKAVAHREEEGRLDHDVSAKFLVERDGVFSESETKRNCRCASSSSVMMMLCISRHDAQACTTHMSWMLWLAYHRCHVSVIGLVEHQSIITLAHENLNSICHVQCDIMLVAGTCHCMYSCMLRARQRRLHLSDRSPRTCHLTTRHHSG